MAQYNQNTQTTNRWAIWSVTLSVLLLILLVIFYSLDTKKTSIGNDLTDSDFVKGNKDSKIILIEYSDFQCPACKAYSSLVNDLMKEFGTKIKFVYRQFPLRENHKNAETASRTAISAGQQGKFWEMHDLLFENQSAWGEEIDPSDTFANYAKSIGLDMDKFTKDLSSKSVIDKVESDYQSGIKANITGTPTFFLNGKQLDNPRGYEEFKKIIEDEIQKNP